MKVAVDGGGAISVRGCLGLNGRPRSRASCSPISGRPRRLPTATQESKSLLAEGWTQGPRRSRRSCGGPGGGQLRLALAEAFAGGGPGGGGRLPRRVRRSATPGHGSDWTGGQGGGKSRHGMGSDPGTNNLLALWYARKLDTVEEIALFWAVDFSELTGAARAHGGGMLAGRVPQYLASRLQYVEGGEGEETVEFMAPIGACRVRYVGHPQPLTLPRRVKGLARLTVKGAILPAWADHLLMAQKQAGLLSETPVQVRGVKVRSHGPRWGKAEEGRGDSQGVGERPPPGADNKGRVPGPGEKQMLLAGGGCSGRAQRGCSRRTHRPASCLVVSAVHQELQKYYWRGEAGRPGKAPARV